MLWFRKLGYNETHCNTAQKQPLKQKFHLLIPGQKFPPLQCVCVCAHIILCKSYGLQKAQRQSGIH